MSMSSVLSPALVVEMGQESSWNMSRSLTERSHIFQLLLQNCRSFLCNVCGQSNDSKHPLYTALLLPRVLNIHGLISPHCNPLAGVSSLPIEVMETEITCPGPQSRQELLLRLKPGGAQNAGAQSGRITGAKEDGGAGLQGLSKLLPTPPHCVSLLPITRSPGCCVLSSYAPFPLSWELQPHPWS